MKKNTVNRRTFLSSAAIVGVSGALNAGGLLTAFSSPHGADGMENELSAGGQSPSNANNSNVIRISDFGLQPNSRENAVPYVQKALMACRDVKNPVLIFEKGRYDFWTQHIIERVVYVSNTLSPSAPKRLAIFIEGMNELTIDGNGSNFVFHDRMKPIVVDNSANITIKNLTIDWDVPLMAQANVLAVTDEYIDVSINICETPYIIENDKLVFVGEGWKGAWRSAMEFDKDTHLVSPKSDSQPLGRDWQNNYRAVELSPGNVRLIFPFSRKPAVGNWLVLRHPAGDGNVGMFINESKNIIVENIDIYHCPGKSIVPQYSENMTFRNVRCIPNHEKGRIFSACADGIHLSGCKGDVLIENCVFQGLMDDALNVHGTAVRIMEKVDDFTLRCKFMHHESMGFQWGRPDDMVGFIDNNCLTTYATGIVKEFRKIDDEWFVISFRQAVDSRLIVGHVLENLTWTCNVLLKNSQIKSSRARGILISTSGKIVVENNVFESSGSAILIAGDANFWYETGAVKDVTITKNIFKAPCMTSMYQFTEGIISIFPTIPNPDPDSPYHKNIRIVDNEFHPFDYPVLYAKSVEGLTFSMNKLIRSRQFEPFHRRKAGITLEFCKKITIDGNFAEGDVLGKEIKLESTPESEVNLGSNDFFRFA